MVDTDTKQLIDSLKNLIKSKGLTYKQIAKDIDLSEVSIKRVFSNYDCSLSRLSAICSCLEITLLDLSELTIKNSQNHNYFLNDKQDAYFANNPFHFLIFKLLTQGKTNESILEQLNIKSTQLTEILINLDKLSLIKLHENNRVQLLAKGLIRPPLEGRFFEKVIKKQNTDFLNTVYQDIKNEDCCFQSSEVLLTTKTYKEMVNDIHELGKKYREKAFLESKTVPNDKLTSIRWLFAFLPYKTQW